MPTDDDSYPDFAYVEHLIETSTDKVLAAETAKLSAYVQQAWADGYNAPHLPAGHPISSAESLSLHTEGGLSAYPRRNR